MTRPYKLKRSKESPNDKLYAPEEITLPKNVSLVSGCPPITDQGQLGSCSAHAGVAAYEFLQLKSLTDNKPAPEDFGTNFTPCSRLFLYYCERQLQGTVSTDSGASLRDCVTALAQSGLCPEGMWPYDISDVYIQPPKNSYATAASHKISQYQKVNGLYGIRHSLSLSVPVLAGIEVYDSFESDSAVTSGTIPMPDLSQEEFLGGHAILLVGYDDESQTVSFRNSWGPSFGVGGYGTLPYTYVADPDLFMESWIVTA